MLEKERLLVHSACDVCGQLKDVEIMCTQILNQPNTREPEKTCWSICQECLDELNAPITIKKNVLAQNSFEKDRLHSYR